MALAASTVQARPPAGAAPVGSSPPGLLRDVAGAAAAAAVCLAVVVVVLRLWTSPSVPLSYSKDAIYYDSVVKGTLDHGWYLHNPDVGAPFELDNHDFPVVSNDSLQLLLVKVIGLVAPDRPFLVSNAFYVLTFPLNALAAYAALRWRRTDRLLAVLGASVFGLLPLQFMKGSDYLFFVSSYMVPIGCALVLTVLAGEPLFRPRAGATGWRALATPRAAALVLLCAAIASASIYYALFTCILLASAAVARGVLARSRRALAEGFGLVLAIGAFAALNQLPTILYRLRNGPNPMVAVRNPAETELYGLKLIQLVLPIPGHRIGPFADLTDRYRSTSFILGEAQTSIGIIASVGMAWLLVVALSRIIAPDRRAFGGDEERNAAFALVLALLWATTGGLAAIVSYTLTSQFRTWSRMSVFVAFLAIVGVVGLLDRLRRRLQRRLPLPAASRVFGAVVAALVLLAALDQTSPRLVPDRVAIEREYSSDAELVRRIEERLPSGSAILQLPYVAYPEGPLTNRMGVYDGFRPYLHSTTLRWSFGAMRGRPEDWHADVADLPLAALLAGAAASGFSGLVVDRFGYADSGAALEAELGRIIGPPAVVGATDRHAYWDLAALTDRLAGAGQPLTRLAELTLRPIHVDHGGGFYPEDVAPGVRARWSPGTGTLTLHNPGEKGREVILSAAFRTARPGPGTTTLRLPDGTTTSVRESGAEPVLLRQRLTVPPGRSEVRLDSDAQPVADLATDRRRLVVQMFDTVLIPVELCDAAAVLGATGGRDGCPDASRAQRP